MTRTDVSAARVRARLGHSPQGAVTSHLSPPVQPVDMTHHVPVCSHKWRSEENTFLS